MSEFMPVGKNLTNGRWTIEDSSFITKMAQEIVDNTPIISEIEGSPIQTEVFPFDGFKVAGYASHFGPHLRYIRPEDKTKAFQIVLNS